MGLLVADPEDDEQELDPAQDEGGTDESQQPDQPDAAEATKPAALTGRQPNDLQAAYTQATQQNAELKRALGLPKNAKIEAVQAAIAALQQPPEQATDWDNMDPAVAERLAQNEAVVWQMAGEAHGEELATAAQALYEKALKERNPAQFLKDAVAMVLAVTYDPSAADEDQEPQQVSMPEVGSGDVPVVQRPTKADPTGGRRDSGDLLGFVRGIVAR